MLSIFTIAALKALSGADCRRQVGPPPAAAALRGAALMAACFTAAALVLSLLSVQVAFDTNDSIDTLTTGCPATTPCSSPSAERAAAALWDCSVLSVRHTQRLLDALALGRGRGRRQHRRRRVRLFPQLLRVMRNRAVTRRPMADCAHSRGANCSDLVAASGRRKSSRQSVKLGKAKVGENSSRPTRPSRPGCASGCPSGCGSCWGCAPRWEPPMPPPPAATFAPGCQAHPQRPPNCSPRCSPWLHRRLRRRRYVDLRRLPAARRPRLQRLPQRLLAGWGQLLRPRRRRSAPTAAAAPPPPR